MHYLVVYMLQFCTLHATVSVNQMIKIKNSYITYMLSNLYIREFEKTKADAADPLKAAQVYSNIVKAVNEAEEAAKRAIKAAEDSIQIVGLA